MDGPFETSAKQPITQKPKKNCKHSKVMREEQDHKIRWQERLWSIKNSYIPKIRIQNENESKKSMG
jgi:hypothetical protein